MFSDIQKLMIGTGSITVSKEEKTFTLNCDVLKLMSEHRAQGQLITSEFSSNIDLVYRHDFIHEFGKHEKLLFCPHDMYRCIIKDFNKGRTFDLSYRKHLVYDYSKDHFNLVVPYDVPSETLNRATILIREHSGGKNNKPTGIVLRDKVIIVKGEDNFAYTIQD